MARFATFTVGSQVIVLPKGLKFTCPKVPETNYIDTLVDAKLKKLRIRPSDLCTDEAFLRRVLPRRHRHAADARGVRARSWPSTDADKREQAGRRAARPQGVRRDVGDEVGRAAADPTSQRQVSYKAMLLYYNWLQDKIAKQRADRRDGAGAARRQRRHVQEPGRRTTTRSRRDILKVAENVAQVFMGMRIQCAQCHNHPFDRWTMDDYYGFAAFFAADRPQARRRPARVDRLQLRRRRSDPPGRRPRDEAEVPRRRRARRRPARTAAQVLAKWLRVAGEPVLRHEPGQQRLGPLLRPRHRRAGRRRPRQQPAVEPGAAARAGRCCWPRAASTCGPSCARSATAAPTSRAAMNRRRRRFADRLRPGPCRLSAIASGRGIAVGPRERTPRGSAK